VWVKNATGWSAPIKLNAPRAQWISEKQAWAGQKIKIVGRNFHGAEFGAANGVVVRLKNGSSTYNQSITSSNAYMAEFTIGSGTPQGTYDVEVSNDNGAHWSKPSSGQQLQVVAVGSDPLGLGVAWAGNFNWSNQVNASSYGANPNSGVDETADIQAAIDAAGANPNGGVVYLANGTYRISSLHLSRKVVLMGQSKTGTILQYIGTANDAAAIDSKTYFGQVGVANLTMTLAPGHTSRPDFFMQLGMPWASLDGNGNTIYPAGNILERTAEQMFIKNVKVDYPLGTNGAPGQRGFPMMTLGKERFLVADSEFRGFAGYAHNYVNQYSSFTNSTMEFSFGVYINTAEYYVATGNTIVGYQDVNAEKHGLSVRANNYVADNTIVGMRSVVNGLVVGHENDGEAIMSEAPGGYFNYGTVASASGLNVTVNPDRTLTTPIVMYSYPAIQIIDGTGLGQLRRVTGISGNVITVDRAWDKAPDSTSKWTLISPNENSTMVNNTITDNDKGIWLFGNSYDSVVADNRFLDSEGIFIWSVNVKNANESTLSPNYFNRIKGNVLTGVS
jgi:parallel beta-helix repeat protein